jgi:hypothetical protein
MGQTTYRLMRQKDARISVEMTKSSGRRCIISDFRDEAEANAWIIQTDRLIEAAHPHISDGCRASRLSWAASSP